MGDFKTEKQTLETIPERLYFGQLKARTEEIA